MPMLPGVPLPMNMVGTTFLQEMLTPAALVYNPCAAKQYPSPTTGLAAAATVTRAPTAVHRSTSTPAITPTETTTLTPSSSQQGVNKVVVCFNNSLFHYVSGDTFTNGQVTAVRHWATHVWNSPDETGAPIKGLSLAMSSGVAFDSVSSGYLVRMGPPTYEWFFGDVPEEPISEGYIASAYVESSEQSAITFAPGFDCSRSADRSDFSAPGIQTLTISLTPRDYITRTMINVHALSGGPSESLVDPVILSPTTGENIFLSPDGHDLSIDAGPLSLNTIWTIRVTIQVTPKVSRVHYVPFVGFNASGPPIQSQGGTVRGGAVSYTIPEVGTWTWSAQGSYDWTWNDGTVYTVGLEAECYSYLTAATNPASEITSNAATLNGTVNPHGPFPATAYFEWGLNPLYGNATAGQPIGGDKTNVGVSARLTGLLPDTTYHYRLRAGSRDETAEGLDVSFTTLPIPVSQLNLALSPGGASTASTVGGAGALQTGYSTVDVSSGSAPYATGVFSFSQNGVVVSEAAVPASPPTTAARIFVDYRTGVQTKTNQASSKTVDIDTGMALVNRGTGMASITFQLRNSSGNVLATGHGALAQNAHNALFINELSRIAPDFILPANFPTANGFGSLDITSDQPISILALRLTANERNETLLSTTPIADLTKPLSSNPLFFPHFADGGDYRTSLFLLNTSTSVEGGTARFFKNDGSPLAVRLAGDPQGSASIFTYSIPAGGFAVLLSDGSPDTVNTGSVQITPDVGTPAPVGAGVFSYAPAGTLVTESGIPAVAPTTEARIYIDRSTGHSTGLAIAAPNSTPLRLVLNAFATDGITPAGSGALDLGGNGHVAKFDYEFIPMLSNGFTGVLDIASSSPFVALTIRSLTNARGDFLLTTFPIADFNQPAPTPILFPQIADGGGYKTQFILLSTGGAASATISFFDNQGSPLAIGKTPH